MNRPINFGTSGWRDVIAEGFTFERSAGVFQAIAEHVRSRGGIRKGVWIAHDTRFLAKEFASQGAGILAGNGVRVSLASEPAPTPAIAHAIRRDRKAGGVNVTASHNPARYLGIKFSPDWGGPALPGTTRDIERRANRILRSGRVREMPIDEARKRGRVRLASPKAPYLRRLTRLVDFDIIRRSGIRITLDLMYGTACGYLDEILRSNGIRFAALHDTENPSFGGRPPDPAEHHLLELRRKVARGRGLRIGLATDCDADRYGVVDGNGAFIEPNLVFSLLADYLIRTRGLRGAIARSVATTSLIDAIGARYGMDVQETAIGFKYIGEMLDQGEVVMGGEESAGFAIKGHVPEKDGIFTGLLAAEMVAREKRTIRELTQSLYRQFGKFETRRIAITLDRALRERLQRKLERCPQRLAGRRVERVNRLDGAKLYLDDGSWLLLRPSGTEPVVRLYAEAPSLRRVQALLRAASRWVRS